MSDSRHQLQPGPSMPSWDELTDEQRYILYEGATGGQDLIGLLNGWVVGPDASYWNRKGDYVAPLAAAAKSLVQLELIEVWAEPGEGGEGGLMLKEDAAEAVGIPSNWWNYDPDLNWDPTEDLSGYAAFENSNTASQTSTFYTVITTDSAVELGLARYPWRRGA